MKPYKHKVKLMDFGSKSRKSHFGTPKSLFHEIITFLVILAFSVPGTEKWIFTQKRDFSENDLQKYQ